MTKLVDSLLETEHLYRQNAAFKHGVPEPPQRVKKRLVERVQVPEPQQPAPQPQPAPEPAPPITPPVPPAAQTSPWPKLASTAAKLATAALLGGLGVYAYQAATADPAPVVTPDNQTLLEFLEREGYNR